jgi:GTP 3',8-cyclase
MPEDGVPLTGHGSILSFEEMAAVVREAVALGVDKVRLTGGEPLVRRGVIRLVESIARIEGIRDFAMTTNAILLPQLALELKKAGLHRVNVSLDTMNPDRFREITRGGDLNTVLAGIAAATEAGLTPVKLNCVIQSSIDEPDAREVAAFAASQGIEVRFIRQMNMVTGDFWVVVGGTGGDCSKCGRIRVTATGDVLPCLFSDLRFNVREMGIRGALLTAVENKPESGRTSRKNHFYTTGG